MILVPIIEKYSSFTKGEQQIADYILNNPEEALSKTASDPFILVVDANTAICSP